MYDVKVLRDMSASRIVKASDFIKVRERKRKKVLRHSEVTSSLVHIYKIIFAVFNKNIE